MSNEALLPGITGGIQAMIARWVITGEIVLKTATHFRGSAGVAVDMPVLRDPRDGVPLLLGTSLAGALRSHLADILGGYRSKEKVPDIAALFGSALLDSEGARSLLIVFDSLGKLPDGMSVEIRDGVAIEPTSGTVEAHKKFDMEVLPAGTIFPVRMDLIVPDTTSESRLVNFLVEASNGLTEGDIALGMRRSRGLGAVTARNWRAIRHDLTAQEGWLNWLTSDAMNPIGDDVRAHDSLWKACYAVLPISREEIQDKRERVVIDAELSLLGGILVRSPAATSDAPDTVHLVSGGQSVLPGTSLAGILRNRALKIARIVSNKENNAEIRINSIFGTPQGDQEDSTVEHTASRLTISESVVTGGTRMRPSRIRIDRFTQGVAKSALFDEEPDYGGKAAVRLELRNPKFGETGLLLLLLKDLFSGDLNVGGASSVGRGVINGTARIRFVDKKMAIIGSGLKIADETKALLNEKIAEFRKEVRS
ncbi:MAG: RAMP superfamily CRISPR-associated protein [bacterium]|nr:RAMP superfamily CRISPR-associated protein [bacterium]